MKCKPYDRQVDMEWKETSSSWIKRSTKCTCSIKKVADQTEDGEQNWTGWYNMKDKTAETEAGHLEGEGHLLKTICNNHANPKYLAVIITTIRALRTTGIRCEKLT